MITRVTKKKPDKPLSLIIGNFDGIHRGHQSLIRTARRAAESNGCEPALLRFDPHPAVFFSWSKPFELIQTEEQTLCLLRYFGVVNLFNFNFNQKTMNLLPRQFVELLNNQLNIRHIIVGENFRFGYKRAGSADDLRQLASQHGIEVCVCKHIEDETGTISSTRVRNAIKSGDMVLAEELLGRLYFIGGKIINGIRKGREMGTPTANMKAENHLLPKHGVYATWMRVDREWYPSITHIGERPTRKISQFGVETHLLDITLNCYQKNVLLAFTQYLRKERQFNSFRDLQIQIKKDIQTRRECSDYGQQPSFDFLSFFG